MSFQEEKKIALAYLEDLDKAKSKEELQEVFKKYISDNYEFKASFPFREIKQEKKVIIEEFWLPLKNSFRHLRRRKDVFIAGDNEINPGEKWVMCLGHLEGLFEEEWLGIKPNYKLAHIRVAEFMKIENGKITKTGLFFDLIGVMLQAGLKPLPEMTGNYFVYPGPIDHNGLLFEDADPKEAELTRKVMNEMVENIDKANKENPFATKKEMYESNKLSWSEDMIWYGPAGVGAQYSIEGYIHGHQAPFRHGLGDKYFNGHVCRLAEGNFSCFFGWPNLTNRPIGGFMGLPGGNVQAEMQVVDVYYRKGNKLHENWVIIDIPHWLNMQGLDILKRNVEITSKSNL